MLLVVHDSSLCEDSSDDEPRGGSGQETGVQCRMDSDTSQGEGGGTLVSCRDNGGRSGTESGLVYEASVHHGTCEANPDQVFLGDQHLHLNLLGEQMTGLKASSQVQAGSC